MGSRTTKKLLSDSELSLDGKSLKFFSTKRTGGGTNESKYITSNLLMNLDAGDSSSYSGSGDTWYDLNNGGYNVTLNGPSWSNTNSGIFTYDGTDDVATFDKAAFTLGSTFTIEIWYRFTSSQTNVFTNGGLFTQGAAGDWNTSVGSNKGLILGANEIVYRTSSNTQIWTAYTSTPSQNNWHQFVFTFDSGTGKVLMDGATSEIYSATNFQSSYSNTNGLYGIGLADAWGGYRGEFIGDIAIFRVYSVVLTASEIQQNFDALKNRYGL